MTAWQNVIERYAADHDWSAVLTTDERDALRTLTFDRLDAWHAASLAAAAAWHVERAAIANERHAVTFADGRSVELPTERSQRVHHEAMYSSDNDWSRYSFDTRGKAVQTPIRPDWARRRLVAQSIKSRGRFLTWFAAAMLRRAPHFRGALVENTWRASTGAIAPDALMAAVDIGIADLDRVSRTLYVVTPRDTKADWEQLLKERKHVPKVPEIAVPTSAQMQHAVDAFTRDAFGHYAFPVAWDENGNVTERQVRRVDTAHMEPPAMVPTSVYAASAADPSRPHLATWNLDRATHMVFAEQGERYPAADVLHKLNRRIHSRPDSVAFRGVPRWERPNPVKRYQRRVVTLKGSPIKTELGPKGELLATTQLAWHVHCECGRKRDPRGIGAPFMFRGRLIEQHAAVDEDSCTCLPRTFIGHTMEIGARTVRGKRKASRVKRVKSAAKPKGPIAGTKPWNMNTDHLARSVNRKDALDPSKSCAAMVARIDAMFRMCESDDVIQFATGELVQILDGSHLYDIERERAYPYREWARRAALDGASL